MPNTPQAKNDTASTNEDAAINIPVLANDLGGNAKHLYSLNQTGSAVVTTATTALGATVTMNADGTVAYDPTKSSQLQALVQGQTADDTFKYTMQLGKGVTSTATVTVHVAGDDDTSPTTSYSITTFQVPGSSYTGAYGINNNDQIVGYYNVDVGNTSFQHGFIYDHGTSTTIDVPGASFTDVFGINDLDQVVGVSSAGGFLKTDKGFTAIEAPGSIGTEPRDINNLGDIVGRYDGHAFADRNGQFITITPPGSTGSLAFGINDLGQVVGSYSDQSGREHGFLYTNGKYTTVDVPGSVYTQVHGINASGQMVGDYFDGVTVHGFVDTGGQFVTVDGPGAIDYTHLNGINDSGDISGMYGTGSLQGSFIATPTGNSAATASVRLSDLLSSQTANISMADLLPAVGGSGSPSAQSASLGGPVDQGVALGGRLAVPGLTDTPMSMWPTNSG